jgi:hypothetical protein
MSKYDVELKIERDAEGKLMYAGAHWAETLPSLEHALMFTCVVSVFLIVVGLIWLAAAGMNGALGFGFLGLILSVGMLLLMPGQERGLYFYADGRMQTPWGIYYRPHLPAVGGNHSNIVSIEARMQREQPQQGGSHLFEVVMLSSGGDLIWLSRSLHEWVALKAAAQLTQALTLLRREEIDAPFDGAWVEYS